MRTTISGAVFFPLILLMFQERRSRVKRSRPGPSEFLRRFLLRIMQPSTNPIIHQSRNLQPRSARRTRRKKFDTNCTDSHKGKPERKHFTEANKENKDTKEDRDFLIKSPGLFPFILSVASCKTFGFSAKLSDLLSSIFHPQSSALFKFGSLLRGLSALRG